MHTGKQKQMNASYQASLVNRHIRRFTGLVILLYGETFGQQLESEKLDAPSAFKRN